MKKFVFICLMLVGLLMPRAAFSSVMGDIRVSLIEGDVQFRSEDSGEWVPMAQNMPLMEGDSIWVPEGGRLEIQMRDGTCVRLRSLSAFDILRLEDGSMQFYLSEGSAYVNFRGTRGRFLQLDTHMSSIRTYDRSRFRVDVNRYGDTDLSVFKGSAIVEYSGGNTRVDADNLLAMTEDNYPELYPLDRPDEWEMWNRERDRYLARKARDSRYLPDELDAYAGDLDNNGRWVSTPEYGDVWIPTGVSAGWAPYRLGRWAWIGGDYIWISFEPWGWAPYHYGRWAFMSRIGWCWVPPHRGQVYWGPGFVGWVSTPTYVSWVPLAPEDTYYGYGNYGPNSVNILTININIFDTRKVHYRNSRFGNAVTTLHHDTFIRGGRTEDKIGENPFERGKIHIGRPDIKPERTSYMPLIKNIPAAKRPPREVLEIRHKDLKQERNLVKDNKGSAMRPGFTWGARVSREAHEKRDQKFEERRKGGKPIGQGIKPAQPAPPREEERKGGQGQIRIPAPVPPQQEKGKQPEQKVRDQGRVKEKEKGEKSEERGKKPEQSAIKGEEKSGDRRQGGAPSDNRPGFDRGKRPEQPAPSQGVSEERGKASQERPGREVSKERAKEPEGRQKGEEASDKQKQKEKGKSAERKAEKEDKKGKKDKKDKDENEKSEDRK